MEIKEITKNDRPAKQIIDDLKRKSIAIPAWTELRKQYEPKLHPVKTDKTYTDKVTKKGIERVTRYTLGWQKLAVKRMTELIFGIPVQRVYKPENNQEKTVGEIMEAIFSKNRINSVNIERGRYLFASCEAFTLWYSQEQPVVYAGQKSKLKLRCKNLSPMNGDSLYPFFDEYDDMIAFSVEYSRKEADKTILYFDTYTADEHIRWRTEDGKTDEELRESIQLEKIPGVYIHRPEPIWEDQSENVYEAEWTLSRNGNYIRKNSRPNWVVFSDDKVKYGKESASDNEGRNVLQYGQNDKAGYVSWEQAIESLKFHIDEIRKNFFTELQIPDISAENLKLSNISADALQIMFTDAELKVTDESGIWLAFFDREINVVRAFMKKMYPSLASAIDNLIIEVVITPYNIKNEAQRINNLSNAAGGKAIMSRRTAIRNLGYAEDEDEEIALIIEDETQNLFSEPTI